jgi:glutathione S-transferase kappa 1
VTSDDKILEYLSKSLGADIAKDVLAKADSQSVKDELTKFTTEAVETYGAFGAPWILVHFEDGSSESFWGSDRFEAIAFKTGKPWHGPVPSVINSLLPSTKL